MQPLDYNKIPSQGFNNSNSSSYQHGQAGKGLTVDEDEVNSFVYRNPLQFRNLENNRETVLKQNLNDEKTELERKNADRHRFLGGGIGQRLNIIA